MKILILQLDDHKVDKQGHILPEDADVQMLDQVLIYKDFNRSNPIGTAIISREGSKFYATITLSKEVDIHLLTPAIGGVILKKHTKDHEIINSFKINELSFSIGSNCDDRIKSVKDQINDNH